MTPTPRADGPARAGSPPVAGAAGTTSLPVAGQGRTRAMPPARAGRHRAVAWARTRTTPRVAARDGAARLHRGGPPATPATLRVDGHGPTTGHVAGRRAGTRMTGRVAGRLEETRMTVPVAGTRTVPVGGSGRTAGTCPVAVPETTRGGREAGGRRTMIGRASGAAGRTAPPGGRPPAADAPPAAPPARTAPPVPAQVPAPAPARAPGQALATGPRDRAAVAERTTGRFAVPLRRVRTRDVRAHRAAGTVRRRGGPAGRRHRRGRRSS
jgi:hypothetical protein